MILHPAHRDTLVLITGHFSTHVPGYEQGGNNEKGCEIVRLK
ncbi:hypothetical protein FORC82_p165 (plasmid) [Escherichia coli]|uniref:Uncharacterized protein n=4 Tax=Enterobacteriaceae TaxID=543 RepID=A0A173GLR7_ECOLX|nr:hypothetical protein pSH111_227_62 [Salmonella enterica subsp. enterica serovar Heidelberg]AKB10021.1 recombinase [Salmonella enterica subsp. enterica serovar Enteritidis]AKG90237.1 hypothetical protein [Salmonella enterica subsp. enterica serovar Typhimurium]ANA09706.1 hypothetical protein pHNSHP45-2-orf00228 [Escherichia coli]UIX50945.1 hypothetical protein [Escherichia coli O23:H4]